MDIASIASAASEMKAAETQYAANIKVMKMALDSQKAGLSLLSPLDVSANVNRASEGTAKGSMVDILA
ncbi:putative motility protein [Seleniivibrio woodruffii]|uniref:putative motility protein n=1 Tax=Seleniivibrio woodruffii TaxID=1078050 RepID=UPI0039E3816F